MYSGGTVASNRRRGASYAAPPEDWRMPATVTVSAGLSASEAALDAAQATADAKTRPSVTVGSGNTEYIEWTVAEAGDCILSFIGSNNNGSYAITVDTVDEGFALAIPGGSPSLDNVRRQGHLMTLTAGQVVRLTITATGGSVVVSPLLHLKPASGPWDAHLIFGASRENQGSGSYDMETTLIADYPTRDPLVFNYSLGTQRVDQLAAIADDAALAFGGLARYAYCGGSMMTNNVIQNRPYDSSELATINSSLDTIQSEFEGAGMTMCFSSIAFGNFGNVIDVENQDGGALEYDNSALGPWIATNLPDVWDSAAVRPKMDIHLLIMNDRGNLSDTVHGNGTQYAAERAYISEVWHGYIYTGSWTYTRIAELRVAEAEAEVGDEANLYDAYLEATYAVYPMPTSSLKTDWEARIADIAGEALFYHAKDLITVAEGSATQGDVDAAQAALDAAETAGFVDMASPNTLAEQQQRIDDIVVATHDQIINIAFGGTTPATTGWTRLSTGTSAGTLIADCNDDQGNPTGIALVFDSAGVGNLTNSGLVSAIPDIPSSILAKMLYDNSGSAIQIAGRFTGLDPAKTYDVVVMCSSSGAAPRPVRITIQGTILPDIEQAGNVSNPGLVTDVVPNGSNEISFEASKISGGVTTYLCALQLKRHI